jgi:hypothetical protein
MVDKGTGIFFQDFSEKKSYWVYGLVEYITDAANIFSTNCITRKHAQNCFAGKTGMKL